MPMQKSVTQPSDPVIADNTTITLHIPWKAIEPVFKKIRNQHLSKLKVPGFRKGKIPVGMAKDYLNYQELVNHTLEHVLAEPYRQAIEKGKYQPITQPEITSVKTEEGQEWEVTAAFAQRPKIDLKKYKDFVKKGKDSAKQALKEAANKAQTAKKDDKITQDTQQQSPDVAEDLTLQHIYRELIIGVKPSIPELLLKQETRRELQQFIRQLDQAKVTLDSYLAHHKLTFEQLSSQIASQVLAQIQLDFILDELAKQEKLTSVEDKDVEFYLDRITDPNLKAERAKDPDFRAYLTPLIIRKKANQHLLHI